MFSDYFRDRLSKFKVEDVLDPKSFNVVHLDKIVRDYVGGKQDIPNHGILFKLALLNSIGFIK